MCVILASSLDLDASKHLVRRIWKLDKIIDILVISLYIKSIPIRGSV